MVPGPVALDRLRQGNRRFVAGRGVRDLNFEHARRRESVVGQDPFAIILGCSDSRVPAELIFDQGVGDLFVIRVAGNIVMPSQIGSVEYAADTFGTKLVVVLGHSNCGALLATLKELQDPSGDKSENLQLILGHIRPSVEAYFGSGYCDADVAKSQDLLRAAGRANIRSSVDRLTQGSEILKKLVSERSLKIVGAEYSLETGVVEFLEETKQKEAT
jgi:carbonic anhydrase